MTDAQGSALQTDSGSTENQEPKLIKPEDHKRAIQDMLKYKTELREKEALLEQERAKIAELQEKSLAEQNNYKALWEQEKQARLKSDQEKQDMAKGVVYNERYKAAISGLRKAGFREDALDFLEKETFEDLPVETTSGKRLLVHGVEEFVERYKQKYSFLFEQQKSPVINGGGTFGAGSFEGKKITPQMVIEAEMDMKRDPKSKEKQENYKKIYGAYVAQKSKQAP